MRRPCLGAITATVLASAALAQRPTLDLQKVHTIVDRDGRSFVGLPLFFTPIPGGQFLVMDQVSSPRAPAIIDSAGRFRRALGPLGEGPGELGAPSGPFQAGAGDTTFVLSSGRISVYGPNLAFVRSVLPASGAVQFIVTPAGFVTSHGVGSVGGWTPFHFIDRSGKTLKSFGRDTARRPTDYLLASGAGGFWAASRFGHRFEKWTLGGKLEQVIEFRPKWWRQINARASEPFTLLRGIRESGGVLWVLSNVPVANIKEVMRAEGQGRLGDGSGPPPPMEKMYTSVLEAYDATTGRHLAEMAIPAAGVTILDDRHVVLFTMSNDDLPQLEIWEMKLRR